MGEVTLAVVVVVFVTLMAAWSMTIARLDRIARALERLADWSEERS